MSYRSFFGTETEYAVTAFDELGKIVSTGDVVSHIARFAAMRTHLRGVEAGVFFPSGRLYIDVGNHPEFASAEVLNPRDGVKYSLAGDRLLSLLAQQVADHVPGVERVVLRKGNVDYALAGATWASHENYLCRNHPTTIRPQLVPHLVSRIIFTGSGGFDPFSAVHPRFVLSPRALFMRRPVSLATEQEGRALVDERNQPHCAGFHRQHLMCGDSLRSHLASFLRLGTTALVLALIEFGLNDDDAVRLADPLVALDTVTRDVSLTRSLELAGGGSTTALAIQRHYLRRARMRLDALPPWAGELCDVWEDTLERLSRGAVAVADRLDWAIKLTVYEDRAARNGLHGGAETGWYSEPALLGPHGDDVAQWRAEMCEIETRFGQIHPPGLFDALDEAGVLHHRVAGIDNIDAVLESPPAEGRARVRGEQIIRLGVSADDADDWACTWDRIESRLSRAWLDLTDPFVEEERWCHYVIDSQTANGLLAQIFRLSRVRSAPVSGSSLRELVERVCHPDARALRRQLGYSAIDINCRAITFRQMRRYDESEWLMRLALAIDLEVRGEAHPKLTHRRNNLSTVLLAQERYDEVDEQLTLAWRIVSSRFDLTSARILLTRLALALLRGEPPDLFIGQLKTHLAIQPLPDYADVVRRTEVGVVFQSLGSRLVEEDRALLTAILAVLNGDQSQESLDANPRWRATASRPLGEPWPAVRLSQDAAADVLPVAPV